MKKRSELFFSLIQVPIDFMMMVAGFVAAYIVRVKIDVRPTSYQIGAQDYLRILLVLLPIWVVIFALNGLYRLSSTRRPLSEVARIFIATASGVMILVILDFFSPTPIFPSKSVPIYGFIFSFVLIFIARQVVRAVQQYLFRFNIGVHKVAIMGGGTYARELTAKLAANNSGYTVVKPTTVGTREWTLQSLEKANAKLALDEIIQANERYNEAALVDIISFADQHNVTYKYVPTLAGLYRANVETTTLMGVPIVQMIQTPLDGWGRIVKRLFDVMASLAALILSSPVMLLIAIVIKLADPGPVIFPHERLARDGRKFNVYKFRTMRYRYCTGPKMPFKTALEALESFDDPALIKEFKRTQKVKNDPRISRVGRFLRRTSLDELPQFYNVLRGDLSLVGPRPIVEEELQRYGAKAARLLAIKPGLTGLWTISGRNEVSYDERARLEIYYVENWSLLLDLIILTKTAFSIIRGSDGY